MARKYQLRRRAERQWETRQRIIDATVALHQEVGPARTTVSAIAERAGVERLTVYRHFPDEASLFQACGGQFIADNPLPDPATWSSIADPVERLRAALIEVYAYFRRTERMQAQVTRDTPLLPALQALMREFDRYWESAREVLLRGWPVPEDRRAALGAAIDLALAFPTWQLLARQRRLDDEEAADLMVSLIACAAQRGA